MAAILTRRFPATRRRTISLPLALVTVGLALLGPFVLIVPRFGRFAPLSADQDFINHVALVAAALDTLRATGALPISSNAIDPGVEYPYFLLGNGAFYLLAALASVLLQAPPYVGAGVIVAAAFIVGMLGMRALAKGAGLNPYAATALGFLYASGPYLCLNLVQRYAFPEYLAWQLMPALLLVLTRALCRESGGWGILAGALALAAPFYIHKLVAPWIVLTLALLALNAAPARISSVVRLGVIGLVAVLCSVPAWLPLLRGLNSEYTSGLGLGLMPLVLHPSGANLFWPYLQPSLPQGTGSLNEQIYQGRFGMQLGLVPSVGLLAGFCTLLTTRRRASVRHLYVPLLICELAVVLIMGALNAWRFLPSPLRYVQFAFRLLGLAHFTGFLLLLYVVGAPTHPLVRGLSLRTRHAVGALFIALATASVTTYWSSPTLTDVVSADIGPSDLQDGTQFYRPMGPSNLDVATAVGPSGWLAIPPGLVRVSAADGTHTLILVATVPESLFDRSTEPLHVWLYGLSKSRPDAKNLVLVEKELDAVSEMNGVVAPIDHALRLPGTRDQAASTDDGSGEPLALMDTGWTVQRLSEAIIPGPGRFEIRTALPDDVSAVAIECSRRMEVVAVYPRTPGVTGPIPSCINVDTFATPNEGSDFVVPAEIPTDRQRRSAFGTVAIDARDLPEGHYVLPTYAYNLSGSRPKTAPRSDPMPTTAVPPFDTTAYTVSYHLVPELLALVAGLGVVFAYMLGGRFPPEPAQQYL